METPELEEFAKLLVEHVRDDAIQNCDAQLRAGVQSPVAQRWRKVLEKSDPKIAEVLIADCVDKTVSSLLRAIDEGVLRLRFVASNGKTVDLTDDGLGELCGWYNGSEGWRASFTKERFVNDCSDLK